MDEPRNRYFRIPIGFKMVNLAESEIRLDVDKRGSLLKHLGAKDSLAKTGVCELSVL
jgi:hypothetical protein